MPGGTPVKALEIEPNGEAGEEKKEGGKNYKVAYILSFLSAIFLGTANFFVSLLASLGVNAFWLYWAGILIPYLVYHLVCYIKHRRSEAEASYISKENSMYYVKQEKEEEY